MKICLVRAELFRADGRTETNRRTDIMKLIVAFRSFVNATKNYTHTIVHKAQKYNTLSDLLILLTSSGIFLLTLIVAQLITLFQNSKVHYRLHSLETTVSRPTSL
jgi:hypothetical protein